MKRVTKKTVATAKGLLHMTPKQLKEARQKLGLTQKAMAERLNTPKSSYLKWEQGSRRVPGIIEAFLKLL